MEKFEISGRWLARQACYTRSLRTNKGFRVYSPSKIGRDKTGNQCGNEQKQHEQKNSEKWHPNAHLPSERDPVNYMSYHDADGGPHEEAQYDSGDSHNARGCKHDPADLLPRRAEIPQDR